MYEEHIKSLLKSKLGEMSESRDVYLSVGGRERRRVMLRVRMEVREGTVLVDLRGSSPSVDSSVNSTWANTLTMCILPFLMLVLPDVPIHQALLERFELLTEQGSIFDTGRPSATSGKPVLSWFRADDAYHAVLVSRGSDTAPTTTRDHDALAVTASRRV